MQVDGYAPLLIDSDTPNFFCYRHHKEKRAERSGRQCNVYLSHFVAATAGESERIGINLKTGVVVNVVLKEGDKCTVRYQHEGKDHEIIVDKVINGVGRIANVASLNLAVAHIKYDGIGIDTNEYLQSVSNTHVWVAGDA